MKNKKIIIIVCVVLLVIVAGGTAIGAVIHNKTDKYTKIIEAYNNTINADSFICNFDTELYGKDRSYAAAEVYGKGDKTVFSNLDEDGVYSVHYNGYYYQDGKKTVEGDTSFEFMKVVADRDIVGLYNYFGLDDFIGIRYDQLYNSGIDFVKDYFTDKEKLDFVDGVSIEDDEYTFSVYFKDFVSWMEDSSSFKAPSEYKDTIPQDTKLTVKLSLDGKFIKDMTMRIYTDEQDIMLINIEFTKINEITDSNSLGIQFITEIENK